MPRTTARNWRPRIASVRSRPRRVEFSGGEAGRSAERSEMPSPTNGSMNAAASPTKIRLPVTGSRRSIDERSGGDRLHDRLPIAAALSEGRMERKHFLQRGGAVRAHHGAGVDDVVRNRLDSAVSVIEKIQVGRAGRMSLAEVCLEANPLGSLGTTMRAAESRPSSGGDDHRCCFELRPGRIERNGPAPLIARTSQLDLTLHAGRLDAACHNSRSRS